MTDVEIFSVHNLQKFYEIGKRKLQILKDISFSISKGERVALLGPSGSGKTTLLNILGCIDEPTSGEIRILGQAPERGNEKVSRLRREVVSYVYQQYHLLPQYSALENVCLPLVPVKISFNLQQRAQELLERVGLGDRMEHMPSELSGGEQQRVAIARALIGSPQVLLCDEPTGNLDSNTRDSILDLLLQINKKEGTTLVIATHDMEVANRCDRQLHMIDGVLRPKTESDSLHV